MTIDKNLKSKKLKKGSGWKYGAGAGVFERGDWHFPYLIFSRFIIFTFRNYFLPFAKLCYAFAKKNYFFLPPEFYVIPKFILYVKNKPKNIPYIEKIAYL